MVKNIATNLIISVIVLFVGLNVPAEWVNVKGWFQNRTLGGLTLTDISGSTAVSAYPTIQNANNLALETVIDSITGTTTNSTITTLSGLTTASSLATVGTITSGTWNGTTIAVNKGGTGSTTLSQFNVLLGSSTNALGIVSGLGSDGQFLTSQGPGLPPQWETSSIDQAGNYAWTGTHSFSNSFSIFNTGTSTISLGLEVGRLIGAPYFNATSTTATSTFRGGTKMDYATTTNLTISGYCFGCLNNSYEIITSTAVAGDDPEQSAFCSTGKKVVGGGCAWNGTGNRLLITASYPVTNSEWICKASDNGVAGSTGELVATAICVIP